MTDEEQLGQVFKSMLEVFIAETMRDPDIASQSAEFKAGYEKATREITAVVADMFLKRHLLMR